MLSTGPGLARKEEIDRFHLRRRESLIDKLGT